MPRATSAALIPARLTAARTPGGSSGPLLPWRSSPRTFAKASPGHSRSSMPVWMAPPVRVPVTTVPLPATENTRSMCSRGEPAGGGEGRASNCRSRAARSPVSPWPVTADTGMTGAPSRKVPCTRAAISARTPAVPPGPPG